MGNLLCSRNRHTELIREIERLRTENDELRRVINTNTLNYRSVDLSSESKEAIQAFASKLVENPDINIRGLPDCIERKIYTNIMTIVLGLVQEFTNTTTVSILGHKLVIRILPDVYDESVSVIDS